ncbi:MAG: family 2 glycosyl transferase, partial [Flavobacteriaceae bacterium]|nr:family 2 glycosyl transferase [Flavobacteriaceae bacterium]
MSFKLKEYITNSGEIILYNGHPNFEKLEGISLGVGDIWHSSFEQGYKNALPELVYQTATFFWYLNDFDNLDVCVSWRINPHHFAVRKSVWETLNGFDAEYKNLHLQALDFGYNALRNSGAVPLYIKGLFEITIKDDIEINAKDRYTFFVKNFKIEHAIFMLFRKGCWKWNEWNGFFYAKKHFVQRSHIPQIPARKLMEIQGKPMVSYIIPTMLRQDFT